MSGWLERLKNQKAPDTHPTKTTKTVSVVSVGWVQGAPEKSRVAAVSANDAASTVIPVTTSSSASTCAGCSHMLTRGTCVEPVAAGLLTEDEGFGIVCPPAGYAATCASYSSKSTAPAQERPYRLTRDQGDTAHADAWDDAAIARFHARVAHIQRRGFTEQDAEDLAEQLHLRDGQADHRHLCFECSHYRPGRCRNHRHGGLQSPEMARDMAARLQRCPGFSSEFASKDIT